MAMDDTHDSYYLRRKNLNLESAIFLHNRYAAAFSLIFQAGAFREHLEDFQSVNPMNKNHPI